MPYAVTLDVELDTASPHHAVGHLPWAPHRCTAGGILHGGALIGLADTIRAVCAYLGLPAGANTATTNSTVDVPQAALFVIGLTVIVCAALLAAFGAITAIVLMLRMRAGQHLLPVNLRLPLPAPMRPAPLNPHDNAAEEKSNQTQ